MMRIGLGIVQHRNSPTSAPIHSEFFDRLAVNPHRINLGVEGPIPLKTLESQSL